MWTTGYLLLLLLAITLPLPCHAQYNPYLQQQNQQNLQMLQNTLQLQQDIGRQNQEQFDKWNAEQKAEQADQDAKDKEAFQRAFAEKQAAEQREMQQKHFAAHQEWLKKWDRLRLGMTETDVREQLQPYSPSVKVAASSRVLKYASGTINGRDYFGTVTLDPKGRVKAWESPDE